MGKIPSPEGSAGLWIFVAVVWASNMGVDAIWFEATCCTLGFMAIFASVDLSQPHPPNASHIILSRCCCWCYSAASQLRQPISWKISCFCCRLQQLLGLMCSLECQCWWNGQGLCSQDIWGLWQPYLVLARVLWDCTHTCGSGNVLLLVIHWEQMAGSGTGADWIADWCGCVAGVDRHCHDENVSLQLQVSLCSKRFVQPMLKYFLPVICYYFNDLIAYK